MVPPTIEFHKKAIGPRYVVSGTVCLRFGLGVRPFGWRNNNGQRSRLDPWPSVRRVVSITDRWYLHQTKGPPRYAGQWMC